MEDKILQIPYSAEAEQSVIGAMILDRGASDKAMEVLTAEDFYIRQNALIFSALYDMTNTGETIDPVTLIEKLKKRGEYDDAGGREYIVGVMEFVPTTANISRYIDIVKDKAVLRKLIKASGEISDLCYEGAEETNIIIDSAEQKIYNISNNRETTDLFDVKRVITSNIEQMEKIASGISPVDGVTTGFKVLDRALTGVEGAGLNRTDLILLAARPGMGKTSLALNIASAAGIASGKDIVIFSLEMSKEQLVSRLLAAEGLVDSRKFKSGDLSEDEWSRVIAAAGRLSNTKIYIDENPAITVAEMKAKCRRQKNLGLIVIDYLQLMQSPSRSDNRTQEVAAISRALKIMAKELRVPVLCLSQLSRAPEGRSNKRPMLSDLRESGAIEQDADIVMFLYSDDYYSDDKKEEYLVELLIAKNRHGALGKVDLYWRGQYTRFGALDNAHNG